MNNFMKYAYNTVAGLRPQHNVERRTMEMSHKKKSTQTTTDSTKKSGYTDKSNGNSWSDKSGNKSFTDKLLCVDMRITLSRREVCRFMPGA